MLSIIKMAHVGHVVGVKFITTKAMIGGGMVAGSVAAALMAQMGLPMDYLDGAALLINNAVDAESGTGDPVPAVRTDVSNRAVLSVTPVTQIDGSQALAPPQPIAQLIVVGKRMSIDQQASYDVEMRLQLVARK